MGYKHVLRNAKSIAGLSWGKAKNFVHGAKEALDQGISLYNKLKPIADDAVQAFGNTQAKAFNQKAQADIDHAMRRGHAYHREIAGNVEKVDALGNDLMNAFR